jgi:hypothetical protein
LRKWKLDRISDPPDQPHHSMGSEGTLPLYLMHDADYNHRLTAIQEISHINFTALTMLNLTGNNLQSIEGLPNLHIPHIQLLFLCTHTDNIDNNNITSVRVMRKTAWPALECLGIGKG